MIIYKDLIGNSHDNLLTDEGFEIVEYDVIIEVKTKMITKDLNIITNNKVSSDFTNGKPVNDEEGEFQSVEAAGVYQINNLVELLRLVETSFDKRSYLTFIKSYIKDIIYHLKQSNKLDRIEPFQKGVQQFIKFMMNGENFKKYSFFTGSSMDVNGHVALMYYKEEDPTVPIFVFYYDGLLPITMD